MAAPAPSDAPVHDAHDDEDETWHCYRHPDRETALRCLTCERPICVDCANHGPVGIKCPSCAHVPRAARGAVPVQRLVLGAIAGSVTAVIAGFGLNLFYVPFIWWIVAYFAGALIAGATRRGAGGFRDPLITRIATGTALVGVGIWPALDLLANGAAGAAGRDALSLVVPLIAAYGAYQRASH